ncbi:MAG: hypothetical protein ACI8PQ_001645 [Planctomycetota bacterium]|jgi:uncharacterized protein (DUF1697 family)
MASQRYIALLRGINVGGHNKIPMAELRDVAANFGWTEVQTYIQSGNLVFNASGAAKTLEKELENGIQGRFQLTIPVLVRSRATWDKHAQGNPFPEASAIEPNKVVMAECKRVPRKTAADELNERAKNGERVAIVSGALWIHFPSGIARTKLSPALVDRLVGSTVTMRNWRTVLELSEKLAAK